MYQKWAFCILVASLLCPNRGETHPGDASEEEGPSPEYLIGSILSHKAVTGLLGKVVDIPVRQAIEEEDPESPWANFDFGGLVELGLQMGGRALQGEKNLLQGRDTAQKVAGVLSRVPKSRRELAMEARQVEQEQETTETKPDWAANTQGKQIMRTTMEEDYDDVQDVGMARDSSSDGGQSRDRTFGVLSRRETSLAEDYDNIQDIDISRGSNGGSPSIQPIDDDIQDVDQSKMRKARVSLERDQPVTDAGTSPEDMIDDDIQDVEHVPLRSEQRAVNKRQGQETSYSNDYADDPESSFLGVQDVLDSNNVGSWTGGKGARKGHSPTPDYGNDYVDVSDDSFSDIQDVVQPYDIDSRHAFGDPENNFAVDDNPPLRGYGMDTRENVHFMNSFRRHGRERENILPLHQYNEAYGSQQHYKGRQLDEINRSFYVGRSYNFNSFGGRRNIPSGGYGSDVIVGSSKNTGRWDGKSSSHIGSNFRDMHSYGSKRTDAEREKYHGEPLETMVYSSSRPKQEGHDFSRGRYGGRQLYENDNFNFDREESHFYAPIEHSRPNRRWQHYGSGSFDYNENGKQDDGQEDYGGNDNFNYDGEESDFDSPMILQQSSRRFPPPYFRRVNGYTGSYIRKPMY